MKTLILIAIVFMIYGSAFGENGRAGTASWYGDECKGLSMANGKPFDPEAMTCASWFFPLGLKLRVSNAAGASVDVVVTDRGPARRFVAQGRIIDLSRGAFRKLENLDKGLVKVSVEKIKAVAGAPLAL